MPDPADPDAAGTFYGGGRGATTLALALTSAFPIEAGVDTELVRVLVRAGARLDLWPGSGPMYWAIERGRYPTALELSAAGVPIDNLFFAAALNRVDLLENVLARVIDVNISHADGQTALHAAANMGHRDAVTWLLARNADPTLRDTRWNSTAAGKARHFQHNEIAEIIECNERSPGSSNPIF